MTWTDIEAKWAAMTRRVQFDRSVDGDEMVITRAPEQPSPLRDEESEQPRPMPLDSPAT